MKHILLLLFTLILSQFVFSNTCGSNGTACASANGTNQGFITPISSWTNVNFNGGNSSTLHWRINLEAGDVIQFQVWGNQNVEATVARHSDGALRIERDANNFNGYSAGLTTNTAANTNNGENFTYMAYTTGEYRVRVSRHNSNSCENVGIGGFRHRKLHNGIGDNTWSLQFLADNDMSWDDTGYEGKGYIDYGNSLSFNSGTLNSNSQTAPHTWTGYGLPNSSCNVPVDNHTGRAARRGFPCGYYQLDIFSDDQCKIFLNGVEIASRTSAGSSNNVWRGYLGPNDVLDGRWQDDVGANSALRMDLTRLAAFNVGSFDMPTAVCEGDDIPVTNNVNASFINGASGTRAYIWYRRVSLDNGSTWGAWETLSNTGGAPTFNASVGPGRYQYIRRAYNTEKCGPCEDQCYDVSKFVTVRGISNPGTISIATNPTCEDDNVVLNNGSAAIVPTGSGTLRYQWWRYNATTSPPWTIMQDNSTSASYTDASGQEPGTYLYLRRAYVTECGACNNSICEDAYSANHIVRGVEPGSITVAQPICLGQEFTGNNNVTASVIGSGTLRYQWYVRKDAPVVGNWILAENNSTNASFSYRPTEAGSYRLYRRSYVTECGPCPNGNQNCYDAIVTGIVVNAPSSAGLSATDYLWAGQINNAWNNSNNWLEFDGTELKLATQRPTANNNVYIKSGLTCAGSVVNANNAIDDAKRLNIGTGATLNVLSTNQLNIYGNWINSGTFNANQSTINFVGSNTANITSGESNGVFYNVNINKSSATNEVTFLDNAEISEKLNIQEGKAIVPANITLKSKKVEVFHGGETIIQTNGQLRVNE